MINNNTISMINEILDQIKSNVNIGSALYEDDKFIETIEHLNAVKYLLAKEFEKQMGGQ